MVAKWEMISKIKKKKRWCKIFGEWKVMEPAVYQNLPNNLKGYAPSWKQNKPILEHTAKSSR